MTSGDSAERQTKLQNTGLIPYTPWDFTVLFRMGLAMIDLEEPEFIDPSNYADGQHILEVVQNKSGLADVVDTLGGSDWWTEPEQLHVISRFIALCNLVRRNTIGEPWIVSMSEYGCMPIVSEAVLKLAASEPLMDGEFDDQRFIEILKHLKPPSMNH